MSTTLYDYIIPLDNVPEQFQITLGNTIYTLVSKWNDIGQTWVLDILDQNQNPIVCGLPFTTGADLLESLQYLNIGGSLIVYTNGDATAVPTLDNLGSDCNLYFETTVAPNGS